MNEKDFQFELIDKLTPYEVVKKVLPQISEATHGRVFGEIENYNGAIKSYTKETGLGAALGAFQKAQTIEVDVQDSLGELCDEKYRYEVFLGVKELEHYKYRIMFLDYGAISYPAKVVLNKDLVLEISDRYKDTFVVESMRELEDMLDKIINSEVLTRVVQNLIYESLRREEEKLCLNGGDIH